MLRRRSLTVARPAPTPQAAKAAGVDKKMINSSLLATVHDMNGEPMGVVDGGKWDMERPLTEDCSVQLFR